MNSALLICYNEDKEIVKIIRTVPAEIDKDFLVEMMWEGIATCYSIIPRAELVFVDCNYKYKGLLS